MRQFQESIRPLEGIPASRQSDREHEWQAWERRRQAGKHFEVLATNMGAPATHLGAPRITIEQPGKNNLLFGNAASAPGNHSYNISFNNFQNSCILFVLASMYLYSATHFQSVYLDCLQVVGESNLRCASKWQSSELRDKPGGCDWASLEMHLEAEQERVWRSTGRLWSSEHRDALGDRDWANLEMQQDAIIVRTCRPYSKGSRYTLRSCNRRSLDGYWEVFDGWCSVCWDSIHQLVNLKPWECEKVSMPFSSLGELAEGSRSCKETRQKRKLHLGVNS
jgi:hypothetical protein